MINSKLTYIKRFSGAVVVTMLLGCAACAAPAVAQQSAWWNVTASTWPASLPSAGEGTISVLAEDVGDIQLEAGNVTLTDRLPAGLSVQSLSFFANPTGNSSADLAELGFCETTGRVVSCRYPAELVPINPYEIVEMRIGVKVEGASAGALNEITLLGGGGSPPKIMKRALKIGDAPSRSVPKTMKCCPKKRAAFPIHRRAPTRSN
jgi:hypothetical protein